MKILRKNNKFINFFINNAEVIRLLEANRNKIKVYLCINPGGIHLLEENLDKVDW